MFNSFKSISSVLFIRIFKKIECFFINPVERFMDEFSVVLRKSAFFIILGNLFNYIFCIIKVKTFSFNYIKDIINLMNYHAIHVVYNLTTSFFAHLWLLQFFSFWCYSRLEPLLYFIQWEFFFIFLTLAFSNHKVFYSFMSKNLFLVFILSIV